VAAGRWPPADPPRAAAAVRVDVQLVDVRSHPANCTPGVAQAVDGFDLMPAGDVPQAARGRPAETGWAASS